jgi:exodeoxyribonuclease VII small subunit
LLELTLDGFGIDYPLMDGPFVRTGCAVMPPTTHTPLSFEQALAELELILRDLEDSTTNLEDALTRYERGVGLLRQCYAQLQDAEQKVKLLNGLTDDGGADLKPFDHVASIEAAKGSVRKSGKSYRGSGIQE